MRFSLTTVTATALSLLLATTHAAESIKDEPLAMSTPFILARQQALLPSSLTPSAPPSAKLRGSEKEDEKDEKALAVSVDNSGSDKMGQQSFWNVFYSTGDRNMIRDLGNNRMSFTIAPWEESIAAQSSVKYHGGRLGFKVKSGAVMPGVITAVYFASGDGRTGDSSLGSQDEIDFEFKGNEPSRVQTNVFMNGQEALQMVDLGYDSSSSEHAYAIEWDNQAVKFFVDGTERRSVPLSRPLQAMELHMSVWTTTGGWPGLIQWGGSPDWNARGNQPVESIFEITEYPSSG